mmetsp:Transcript_17485/g.38333  ORF Transcript_17485/g.38333 Transcript_17485/m.38333 type:complete len:179 (+) Transcript_17485:86-622(+)
MSDDEWLTSRVDPEEPLRPTGTQQSAFDSSPRRATAVAPAPRLLLRPKDADEWSARDEKDAPTPKTLQEKEAEYAAARARIFGQGRGSGRGQAGRGGGRTPRGGGGPGPGMSVRSGGGAPAMGRRRENHASDPDYDRNPRLYAPRLAPATDEQEQGPEGSRRYVLPTYEAEFPALGGR